MFKFRSGTHGLNEELGRHRGREGKTECSLCGNECENVSHVLWEYSAYSITRNSFMKKLQELLKDDYEDFESLENVDKLSYLLGCGKVSLMDCLAWLRSILLMCGKYEKINKYMIVTQDLVCNSMLSLHLGRGVVSSVRMVSLVKIIYMSGPCGEVNIVRK